MQDFKDLNELITVARQINEGKYSLIDININPSSELFSIAQYFNDSIKQLQAVSPVEKEYQALPAFEATINSVINDSKQASEDVLSFVDKINFNVDDINETLKEICSAVKEGNNSKALGLIDRLKDSCVQGVDICFDIISSLEFKEVSQQKVNKALDVLAQMEQQLAGIAISLGLKQQIITPEKLDKLKDTKEILQDQTLVNELLKEFGL